MQSVVGSALPALCVFLLGLSSDISVRKYVVEHKALLALPGPVSGYSHAPVHVRSDDIIENPVPLDVTRLLVTAFYQENPPLV